MPKKKKLSPKDAEWAKAKKLCRLNMDDIRKAKELGFKPKNLMKNIPSKTEQWKAPVKIWIRDLYYERFGEKTNKETHKTTHNKTQQQKIPSSKDTGYNLDLWDDPYLTVDDHAVYENDYDVDKKDYDKNPFPSVDCDELPF